MNLRPFIPLFVLAVASCAAGTGPTNRQLIEAGIQAQREAGHPGYDPAHVFIVDPASQRMHVLDRKTGAVAVSVRCGTGRNGLGFGDSQTPPGFFTMGGVRIARNADTSIQTGDSKKGVSGVYAEMLYPPSHPDPKLRGRVPNGVVIHSYNPEASAMLRERREKRLIGRRPCTTGCPVPSIDEVHKLVPYLRAGAGSFDPDARPNGDLRNLIARGAVKEYSTPRLGTPIFILSRPER
ncbi:hypothetical protein HAHE_35540 [Haloferula helveola]|uniref:L,D-TPase catalytic domain-containing protein n=1 Tax=Haloferula helveola TaxID=490095 RepID=A0ABN6H7M3_9BACT|nr:hypothetical protein HAHE_35540 [Haloferula helveola]